MRVINTIIAMLAVALMLMAMGCPPAPKPADTPDQPDPALENTDDTAENPATTGTGDASVMVDDEGNTIVVQNEDGETAEISVSPDGGSTTIISGEDGTARLTTGQQLPEGWPEDIAIMEGFEILAGSAYENPDTKEKGMTVVAQGDASIDDVKAFYEKMEGWTKAADMSIPNEMVLINLTREMELLSVQLTVDKESKKSVLTLVYSPHGNME